MRCCCRAACCRSTSSSRAIWRWSATRWQGRPRLIGIVQPGKRPHESTRAAAAVRGRLHRPDQRFPRDRRRPHRRRADRRHALRHRARTRRRRRRTGRSCADYAPFAGRPRGPRPAGRRGPRRPRRRSCAPISTTRASAPTGKRSAGADDESLVTTLSAVCPFDAGREAGAARGRRPARPRRDADRADDLRPGGPPTACSERPARPCLPAKAIDPRLLEILVCPMTRDAAALRRGGAGADLRQRRAGLPDPRRRADHADRRGAGVYAGRAGAGSRRVFLQVPPAAGAARPQPVFSMYVECRPLVVTGTSALR